MIFCENCKHYKCKFYIHDLFNITNYDEKCATEIKIDYVPDPIKGYEKKITTGTPPYKKNKHFDCPDYKVKWWKSLFIKNVEKYKKV